MTMWRFDDRVARSIAIGTIGLSITACQPGAQVPANEAMTNEAVEVLPTVANSATIDNGADGEEQAETKSIIRPDIGPSPTPTPVTEPIDIVIPFPAKDTQPDTAGMALLDTLLADPVYRLGGAITIWGHSDSRGSDAQNLIASRRRAETVRDYLVTKGAAADRITVVALGEARPIAPNRKLDGSDDPEGRARNRRVEVKVDLPHAPEAPRPPSS